MHDIRQIRESPTPSTPPSPAAACPPPPPRSSPSTRPAAPGSPPPRPRSPSATPPAARWAPPRPGATRPSSSACAPSSPKRRTRSPASKPRPPRRTPRCGTCSSASRTCPYDDVPDGPDETANVEIRRWGSPRNFSFKPLEHYEIPAAKPGLDFEAAGRLSGARFVVMKGAMVRLHRALAQFMLDTHAERHGLDRGLDPGPRPRRGDARHRPAAEVRRGQLPAPPTAGG